MFQEFLIEVKPKIDRQLERYLENAIKQVDIPHLKHVLDLFYDFAVRGGKRGRAALVILGYMGVKGEYDDRVVKASVGIELFHDYLLIHDDVIDKDEKRRNKPTVWKAASEYYRNKDGTEDYHTGISVAISLGDLAEALATQAIFDALDEKTAARLVRHYHWVLQETGYGELLDIVLSKTPIDKVMVEDALKVHELKTALYTVEGPLVGGAIAAEAGEEVIRAYREYAIPVGISFQIQDDILGVFGEEETIGKPVGSDLIKGVKTPLIIYAYNNASETEKRKILNVLGNENATAEEIEEVKEIIKSTGALEYATKLAYELSEKGKKAIRDAPIHKRVKEILEDFAEWVVRRIK